MAKIGRPPLPKKPCSVEGCEQHSETRAMCKSHYLKWRLVNMTRVCKIEGCGKTEFSTGLCRGHYARKQRKQKIEGTPLIEYRDGQVSITCRIPESVQETLKLKAETLNISPTQLHRKLVMTALGFTE